MDRERRRAIRRRCTIAGSILTHWGKSADCIVLNLSATGALLRVSGDVDEMPDQFSLLLGGAAGVRRECAVSHRTGTRLGVRFRGSA